MISSNVTTAILLDTRRKNKREKYPVKLRITYLRKQKYYKTKYSLTKEDFRKATGDKPRGEFKDLNLELSSIEAKARKVIKEFSTFSFDKFDLLFRMKKDERNDIFYGYARYIEQLMKEDRIGTAASYRYSQQSIQEYYGKSKLDYLDITPKFLEGYQNWMINQRKSITTVGIYVRCLRCIYNEAIHTIGSVNLVDYPFGRHKYQIPSGKNIKKAIGSEDIGKIFNYKPVEGSPEHRARDYWIFSYLCNGMNFKDIARLTYKNIDFKARMILYYRSKTERTKRLNSRPNDVVLLPEIEAIINKWGNKKSDPDEFVFPIISRSHTPEEQYRRIRQAVKNVNKYMGRIAEEIGITAKVTTYTARHSYATILRRLNASTEFIQDRLGHSDLRTTESYLGSFEDDVKREFANKLIPSK